MKHGTNPGPVPYLTNAEEAELAGFLVDVAKAGYGKLRRDIKWIAKMWLVKNVLKHTKISDGWYRRFMERQSHLSLRKGDTSGNKNQITVISCVSASGQAIPPSLFLIAKD